MLKFNDILTALPFSAVVAAALAGGVIGFIGGFNNAPQKETTDIETCQATVDELANAVSILAVTHKAGLVGTTCMVDMEADELELGQRFKACKIAWLKKGEAEQKEGAVE